VALVLTNLALLYQDQGLYEKAEPLFQRSLTITEARLGKNDAAVAGCLNNLGILYRWMGEYAKAEPVLKRSLAVRESALGKDHPLVTRSLTTLGLLYKSMGQLDKAEPLLQRSLHIRGARLGEDHPDVADSLNNLALLQCQQQHWQEAAATMDRCLRLGRRYVDRVLPALTENEQLSFLQYTEEMRFHVAQSPAGKTPAATLAAAVPGRRPICRCGGQRQSCPRELEEEEGSQRLINCQCCQRAGAACPNSDRYPNSFRLAKRLSGRPPAAGLAALRRGLLST
jgi:tetratricopeptide (TPR) repeat protein